MSLSPIIQTVRVLVAFGYWQEAHGIIVWQHPKFGGVDKNAHRPGSFHYDGEAIDCYQNGVNLKRVFESRVKPVGERLGLSVTFAEYGTPVAGDHTGHWHYDVGSYSDLGDGIFLTKRGAYNNVNPVRMQRNWPSDINEHRTLVKIIQRLVNVTADGVYGKQTKAAVRKFQKSVSVKDDGIFGPKTAAAAFVAFRPIGFGSAPSEYARLAQWVVGVKPDGMIGPRTVAAIKLYQWCNNIVDDGVFGPASANEIK